MKNFHIIVVTYNRKNYLKNCINSIIKQQKVSIHLDIIDNGSRDKTSKYLKNLSKYNSENLKINHHILKKNIDPVLALTTRISNLKGNILNIIGDDDWFNSDTVFFEINEIFKKYNFDITNVFTNFKRQPLNINSNEFYFKNKNVNQVIPDKKLLKEFNSYEIIYSQILQWRLSIKGNLKAALLKFSKKFYREMNYHSSATFFSKKRIDEKKLTIKKILSRPFGDIGCVKMLSKDSRSIYYLKNSLYIGVPQIRETKLIKNPKSNKRLLSYLDLSLKEKSSLKIPLFSIISTNQFIWEVNKLDNDIKVKRSFLFKIYRTYELLVKKFLPLEKLKYVLILWFN